MPWAGGSFSRTDGTRTGTTVWAQAKAASVKIIAAGHDTHDQDLATGINQTINKDGSNAFTGDADLGNNQLTNVGAGSAATDGATIGGTETLTGKTLTGMKWVKGADIASATTLVLGTDGNYFDITGTTTIAGFTVAAGTLFMLQMDGAVTFTHHATNLIFSDGADFISEAGDVLVFFAEAANQVRVISTPRRGPVLMAEIATTSGTAAGFTGIPAWVKRITVFIDGVSVDGTEEIIIQLGDSEGYEATGYSGRTVELLVTPTISMISATTGIALHTSGSATDIVTGVLTLTLGDAANNTWFASYSGIRNDASVVTTAHYTKSLSGVGDRVQITTTGTPDTFDAGAISLMYE